MIFQHRPLCNISSIKNLHLLRPFIYFFPFLFQSNKLLKTSTFHLNLEKLHFLEDHTLLKIYILNLIQSYEETIFSRAVSGKPFPSFWFFDKPFLSLLIPLPTPLTDSLYWEPCSQDQRTHKNDWRTHKNTNEIKRDPSGKLLYQTSMVVMSPSQEILSRLEYINVVVILLVICDLLIFSFLNLGFGLRLVLQCIQCDT